PENPGRLAAWRKIFGMPDPPPVNPREAARRAMANVKIKVQGQTRLVEIRYDSPDPQQAATFANTLADEFIDQNLESRWRTTQRTGEWLTKQLDDLRIKLERSEDALQAYACSSGLVFTSDKGSHEKANVAEEKLRQVQEELSKVQADRIARQSRL